MPEDPKHRTIDVEEFKKTADKILADASKGITTLITDMDGKQIMIVVASEDSETVGFNK